MFPYLPLSINRGVMHHEEWIVSGVPKGRHTIGLVVSN